jgi:hypothetical protein
LLLRSGSVRNEILWEAASSLRNAFAVSCISYGWQRTVGSPNALGNLYADQYDFYPLLPSASNDDLRGMSPAQTIIDVSEHFRGQTYPDVPVARHWVIRSQIALYGRGLSPAGSYATSIGSKAGDSAPSFARLPTPFGQRGCRKDVMTFCSTTGSTSASGIPPSSVCFTQKTRKSASFRSSSA